MYHLIPHIRTRTGNINVAQYAYRPEILNGVYGRTDYDPDPGVLQNICNHWNDLYAFGSAAMMVNKGFVTLTSGALSNLDMLFVTGHLPFSLTSGEKIALRSFVQNGGIIWADDCSNSSDEMSSINYSAFQTTMGHVLTPSDIWLEAVLSDGTLAVDRIPNWGAKKNPPLQEWIAVRFETEMIYASAIRLDFSRLPVPLPAAIVDSLPPDVQGDYRAAGGIFPWSIDMRGLSFSHRGHDEKQYADSTYYDIVGNLVTTTLKNWGANKAIDDNDSTFWKSRPCPATSNKECFYVDIRDDYGRPQLIDRVYFNPLTPGVRTNIYYSTDDSISIQAPLPSTNLNMITSGDFLWDGRQGMMVRNGCFINNGLRLDAKAPWWAGATLYITSALQTGTVFELADNKNSANATLMWNQITSAFMFSRGFNKGVVQTSGLDIRQNDVISIAVGCDIKSGLQLHIQNNRTGYTSAVTSLIDIQDALFDILYVSGTIYEQSIQAYIKNFILKEEVLTPSEALAYIGNSSAYVGNKVVQW